MSKKIVVVTGGSRGIGASIARQCARRGMGVILTYNTNAQAGERVAREIGAQALPLDVGRSASFPAFRDALHTVLRDSWQRADFDVLINNAGYGLFKPIASVSEAEFDGLCNVHLKGPFFLTQTLLPAIADGGQIVNVSSATTRVATAGVAPYASFKGGLEVLTRYMAMEFADRRIRANSIAPGAIRTELGGGLTPEFEAVLAARIALGRVGEPDDIGDAVASMISDDNRYPNAQSIEVAGGYMI